VLHPFLLLDETLDQLKVCFMGSFDKTRPSILSEVLCWNIKEEVIYSQFTLLNLSSCGTGNLSKM